MNFLILFIGIAFAIATAILSSMFYNHVSRRSSVFVCALGIIMSLAIISTSVCFKCPAHLLATLKYDHVKCLEYFYDIGPNQEIDQSKIVYQEDSWSFQHTSVPIRLVILAWDDLKPIDKYEALTHDCN